MRKLPYMSLTTLAAFLTLLSVESGAASLQYRIFAPGVKAARAGGVQPAPVPNPETGTSPAPGTGTTPLPETTPVPPVEETAPPAPPAPLPEVKPRVQFLLDGVAITSYSLPAGGSVTLSVLNTSTEEMKGWLRSSNQGTAYADMYRSIYQSRAWCAQEESIGYTVTLKPGAKCLFVLKSNAAPGSRPADTFAFVGLDNAVIPSALGLVGE